MSGALSTDLPGALTLSKMLVERYRYVSNAVDTYEWIERADLGAVPVIESKAEARGLEVIRSIGEGWAGEPAVVTTDVRIIRAGSARWHEAVPIAVLTNCPDDTVRFLEQYAPEVLATSDDWHQEVYGGPIFDA